MAWIPSSPCTLPSGVVNMTFSAFSLMFRTVEAFRASGQATSRKEKGISKPPNVYARVRNATH